MQTYTNLPIFTVSSQFPKRQKRLLVAYPQPPEIDTCGDGCAFRWNAENNNLHIAENEKTLCE